MDGTRLDMIARAWNLVDGPRTMNLQAVGRPIADARQVTHIETDLGPVSHNAYVLIDPLTRQQMKSWRIRFASRPTGVDPGVLGVSLGFSVYPNPGVSDPQRVLQFILPNDVHVRAELFDIGGRRVRTLIDQTLPAGRQEWRWDGSGLAAGIYVVRLEAAGATEERRIAILN